MPTAAEHLERVAPYLYDPDDARFADAELRAWGLAAAEGWRPTCLGEERQNLAQAWRALYELESLRRTDAASSSTSSTQTVGVAGALVEVREGDVTRRYSDGKTTTGVSQTSSNAGPGTAWSRWNELWSLCGGATGADGQPVAPVRRGGIITSGGFGGL